MSAKSDTQAASRADMPKLIAAAAIVTAAVAAFYYFSDNSLLLRVIGLLVAVGAAAGIIFSSTEIGAQFLSFYRDSLIELRKVVWPTREETVKTAGLVILLVIIMALMLWLLDKLLFTIVRWLTG